MEKKTVALLSAVFALCACAAWTSVAGDGKASAVERAKMLAEKGDTAAQFRYAEMLRDGCGVAKNMREAVTWTRKAADGGLAAAQCQMGLFYMNGLVAPLPADMGSVARKPE